MNRCANLYHSKCNGKCQRYYGVQGCPSGGDEGNCDNKQRCTKIGKFKWPREEKYVLNTYLCVMLTQKCIYIYIYN